MSTKRLLPWLPWPAEEMTVYTERTPENLLKAAEQFRVEKEARYRPWLGKTFCNIFAWDVSRALGCEVPHWVTNDGKAAPPFAPGAREQTANSLYRWFALFGGAEGWRPVESREEAEMRADLGYPTFAVWYNGNGSGHIALMLPGGRIAQAGAKNGIMRFEEGFGSREARFYTHD